MKNKQKFTLVLLVIFTILSLQGCAEKTKKVSQGPVFYPPPPNPPKIQFLTAINGSADIEEKKSSFSLFVVGAPKEDKLVNIFKPYGVTSRAGKIYVSDIAGRVIIIDPENKSLDFFTGSSGEGAIKKPINVAFDADGKMYVVDIQRKEILVYGPDGTYLKSIGKNYDIKPADLIIEDGFLYVADVDNHEIKVIDIKTGELAKTLGKGTEKGNVLAYPTNMASDGKGVFYVTNIGGNNVVKLDKDNHFLAVFGKAGDAFGEFARPKGIAIDPENRFYVVDAGHQNVQIFSDTGRLLMFLGGPGRKKL